MLLEFTINRNIYKCNLQLLAFCKDIFFTFVKSMMCKNEKIMDNMKDRIAHIMRSKNLKATDFAALLGIQPSGVSHVLAGRNKPSLDFVKRIKQTFPEYNLDWIIFGTGPVTSSDPYKEAFKDAQKDIRPISDLLPFDDDPKPMDEPLSPASSVEEEMLEPGIKSIILFYEDGTFDSFTPR